MRGRVLLGAIAGPHGVRGEVKLKCFTADPMAIGGYGPLGDEAGTRVFRITALRPGPHGPVARIEGVDSREAAEALKGTGLWVARAALPEADAEDGEFYVADLIGLRAEDEDAKGLGEVVAVQDYGAGDLLEIRPDGTMKTVLVPFDDDCVPAVDIPGGRVVVRAAVFAAYAGGEAP